MNLIAWLLLGAVAGWGASKVMGDGDRGLWFNIVIGVAGALIGGFLADVFGLGSVTGFNLGSILIAVAGACVLEIVVRWIGRHMKK